MLRVTSSIMETAAKSQAARIFRVERGKRGADTFRGFRDGQIDLDFSLTAELFESASRSAMQKGAGLRDTGVQLSSGFADDHARGLHDANQLAIGDAVGGSLELFGGPAQ